MKLDAFLESQTSVSESEFTATIEAIPDRPKDVKVTPFVPGHGCGCDSSLELPKSMIESVTPTGDFHFCCGKRLEVVAVEFSEDAALPVADVMKRATQRPEGGRGSSLPLGGDGFTPLPAVARSRGGQGIVGRWPIPFTPCTVTCIEVCVEFCYPTGYECCRWETRCGINCGSIY